ncbi:MacS family sensor histidine kinase [Nocardiopsis sp. NPDC101807]|uniref:MacS family sensor histidine kinase n=1 Tax=Nocardiopsis sp. NPDC101807 TaxID=3364339 RepID=UPI00380E4EF2
MGFDVPLWRAFAVFRAATLVYSLVLLVQNHGALTRPWLAWTVLAAMAVWTVAATYGYARPEHRTWRLLTADLAVAFACLFATAAAATPFYLTQAPPLSGYWFAGAALSAAVIWGRRGAGIVALLYGFADLTLRVVMDANITAATARGVVLLLLASLVVGYMAKVAEQAERRFAQAVSLEARLREREQLARSIHDSVLQVLALVSRRGAEAGGEAAELGRMAGEQEVRLRALFADGGDPPGGSSGEGAARPAAPGGRGAPWGAAGRAAAVHADPLSGGGARGGGPGEGLDGAPVDLREPVRRAESSRVSVSAPASPVLLPARTAEELAAAVLAALDNVERHCPDGTRAWVLLEDEPDGVTVSVRDEGPGIAPGRLEEAHADGRLGVAQSIRGRVRDLGGTVEYVSVPGQGTEVEMRVPRGDAPQRGGPWPGSSW